MISQLFVILPEVTLFLSVLVLLVLGAFLPKSKSVDITSLTVMVLLGLAAIIPLFIPELKNITGEQPIVGFTDVPGLRFFAVDGVLVPITRLFVYLGAAFVMVLLRQFMKEYDIEKYEIFLLVVLSSVGSVLMVAATDWIAFYLALELSSLCAYLLASFSTKQSKPLEAGMKYFILGSVASSILLFGISYVYGLTGTTEMQAYIHVFTKGNVFLMFGGIAVLVALLFKLAAAPLHVWSPDVYDGVPTPITLYFIAVMKVAVILFVAKILSIIPIDTPILTSILTVFAVFSLFMGSTGALLQTRIKRLLAYASIAQMGYILLLFWASATVPHVHYNDILIFFLLIYFIGGLGTFLAINMIKVNGHVVMTLDDLAGLYKKAPFVALCLSCFMLSFAGIPPFAGFFAKFSVIAVLVAQEAYILALTAVLFSAVSAFYYLRVLKYIFFDAGLQEIQAVKKPVMRSVLGLLAVAVVVIGLMANIFGIMV